MTDYNGAMKTRPEHDLLGALGVPADAYYGIHTRRAQLNFDLSGLGVHSDLVRALADVKNACAQANLRTGHLDERIAGAISSACEEIASGKLDDQFVTDAFQGAAVNLAKIAGDLRLLSSGPKAGIGEIKLPALQAGSSIMPGKVNPVATEAVSQAAFQIMANDHAIALAAASGQLELNAFLPMIAHNPFQSLTLLKNAADLLAEKCIRGIEADEKRCEALVESSFAMLTALSPHIGYEAASDLAQKSQESGKTIRQVALETGLFTREQLDRILSTVEMTKPGIAGT